MKPFWATMLLVNGMTFGLSAATLALQFSGWSLVAITAAVISTLACFRNLTTPTNDLRKGE